MAQKLWVLGMIFLVLFFGPVALLCWHDTILPPGKVVNSDLIKAGDKVIIDSDINGDSYVFGSTLRSESTLRGDLLALANDVIHNGKLSGSARLAGRNIFIDGIIEKNLSALAVNLTMNQGSHVKGNLVAVGSHVKILGQVDGSLVVRGDEVSLAGEVGKDVKIYANKLIILPRAKFNGNITYYGPVSPIVKAPAAFSQPLVYKQVNRSSSPLVSLLKILAAGLILAAILVALLPKYCSDVADNLVKQPGRNALLGSSFILLIPPLAAMLFHFTVGSAIAFVLLGLYIGLITIALWFGVVTWGTALGEVLRRQCANLLSLDAKDARIIFWLKTLLGSLIICLLGEIPYFGPCLIVVLAIMTLGSLLSLLFNAAGWHALHSSKIPNNQFETIEF